jgi:hypothetical protein
MQPTHPEEGTVLAPFDGKQPYPFGGVDLLRPLGYRIGVLSGQRDTAQIPDDLGIRVERCIVRQIVQPERSKQQPRRRQDDRPVHATISLPLLTVT